jgi:hypothetical protein
MAKLRSEFKEEQTKEKIRELVTLQKNTNSPMNIQPTLVKIFLQVV